MLGCGAFCERVCVYMHAITRTCDIYVKLCMYRVLQAGEARWSGRETWEESAKGGMEGRQERHVQG